MEHVAESRNGVVTPTRMAAGIAPVAMEESAQKVVTVTEPAASHAVAVVAPRRRATGSAAGPAVARRVVVHRAVLVQTGPVCHANTLAAEQGERAASGALRVRCGRRESENGQGEQPGENEARHGDPLTHPDQAWGHRRPITSGITILSAARGTVQSDMQDWSGTDS